MFKKNTRTIALLTMLTTFNIQAAHQPQADQTTEAMAYLKRMIASNDAFAAKKGNDFFKKIAKGQSPDATIVGCSDSRVHLGMLDETPEGNIFLIRNIGNQIRTSLGSVEYGVNHLHSHLLLILGHSNCGAIHTAMTDYSGLELGIISELDSLNITPGSSNIQGVEENVNHQVALALKLFKPQIQNKTLLVVGAVYDFSDDMKHGAGKLNVINIQGKVQ